MTYSSSPLPLLLRWFLSYSSSPCHSFLGGCSSADLFLFPLPLLPRWLLLYYYSPRHSFLGGCSSADLFLFPLPLLPRWLLSYYFSPCHSFLGCYCHIPLHMCHSFLGGCSSSSSSECGSDGGRRTGSSGHFAKLLHQNRRLEIQRRQTHPNLDLDQRSLQPCRRYERVKTSSDDRYTSIQVYDTNCMTGWYYYDDDTGMWNWYILFDVWKLRRCMYTFPGLFYFRYRFIPSKRLGHFWNWNQKFATFYNFFALVFLKIWNFSITENALN